MLKIDGTYNNLKWVNKNDAVSRIHFESFECDVKPTRELIGALKMP